MIYRTIYILCSFFALLSLSGCLERIPHNINSPCVASHWAGNDPLYASDVTPRDPCIRRPVNDWWVQ